MPPVMNKKAPDIVWNNKKDECHSFLLASVCDQILGLIPQVQIRKLLSCANSQIRKFSLLIRKFPQNTAQQCLKTVLKIVFLFNFYYVQILIRVLYAIFVKRKSLYLRTCGSFQFLITKKTGPQIRKMSHFLRKVSKMSHLRKVRKSNQLFKGTVAPD
jgi:hypothetical protein